ncbi:MAG TPA: hypothetical protein PKM65_18770 [Spirochaetota bacterium]|nr:hypothetical protein [Spirochaetota bacterium]HNT11446.1 hypothetical protein [Spirochaetota bacterium]HNV49080.1 hypothetical protein [Spirochaetota bacterium]HOS40295.1 hypothetical protein [Spirochaetota bacterium]HPI24003.1 hypothetical protein [Spirochaetota bacterium]
MKKIVAVLAVCLFVLSFVMVITHTEAGSGFCYMCGSGSPGQYCRAASGKDNSADRNACMKKGCKITGTASCPTAANYKVL